MATTGNPLFDNPQLKAVIAAQMAPPAPQTPSAVMPPPGQPQAPKLQMQTPLNSVPPATRLSNEPEGRGTLSGDQAERQRLLSTGAGVTQIAPKIEGSQFGQNHPLLGKIAGIGAEGLGMLGDVALNATGLGRTLEPLIPGTLGHHQLDLARANNAVGQDEKQAQEEAATGETNARTEEIEHPKTQMTPLETAGGYESFNPQTGAAEPLKDATGQQLQPYEKAQPIQHAVLPDGSVVAISRDPKTGAVSADEVFKGDGKSKPTITKLEVGGKPHNVLIDENTGLTLKDLGETGEKPPTVNVNGADASIDRLAARLGKPYETSLDKAQDKFDRIQQTLHSVDAGYVGQGLAIPELLTSLVSGQGTGVRITQPELNAITANRGIKGNAEAWFNSMAGKGKLTDTDKAQIKGVLGEAQKRLEVKQDILNHAMDLINGAGSREEIQKADKEARQNITDYERTGHYVGQQVHTKDGKTISVTAVHPDGSFDAN